MSAVPEEPFDVAREAVWELVHGKEFAGTTATAYFHLPIDGYSPAPGTANVLVYTTGGTRGYIDRVDRTTVEVYAAGTTAVRVLEAIADALVNDGNPLDLDAGYVDEVVNDVLPHEVPFQSDTTNQARAQFLVTTRLP